MGFIVNSAQKVKTWALNTLSRRPAFDLQKAVKGIRANMSSQIIKQKINLISNTQLSLPLVKGKKLLILIHPNEIRNFVLSEIAVPWVLEKEIPIELTGESPKMEIASGETIAVSDMYSGYDTLGILLAKRPEVKRFILTGGELEACLLNGFIWIIKERPNKKDTLEFYLPMDGVSSIMENPINYTSGLFMEAVKHKASAAIWLDGKLVAATDKYPQIRIRVYSSTKKMLKALS